MQLRAALLVVCAACVSVQDFHGAPASADPDAGSDADPTLATGTAAPRWQWANPQPSGQSLYGIGGTSDSDIWVAGDGGVIAHYNGTLWDIQYAGPETTQYFAIGTQKPGDVWVAGQDSGQNSVVHFDGTQWKSSYPFAGSTFTAFSHGSGPRLFAVTDQNILELSGGTWVATDTSEGAVFGSPVDVWVAPSGEAWTIMAGAELLHLPAGGSHWSLLPPVAPSQSVGLAIAGAGSAPCAFYTGRFAGSGLGFLGYDGTSWKAGPQASDPLAPDSTVYGSRLACLADGSGVFADASLVLSGSLSAAPTGQMASDFAGESALGMWSLDGSVAYMVGALGTFEALHPGTGAAWQAQGPTLRSDLLAVDVGLDGAVMAVDAFEPDRSAGGNVLSWTSGWGTTGASGGLLGPSIPVAVAVVKADDAWVLSSDNSEVGVTHWTGSWGLTEFIDQDPSPNGDVGLAAWAPAKDDVWVTAQEQCPDLDPLPGAPCSQPLASLAWHYDGKDWTSIPVSAAYVSIHGTGPDDVWFAGDGVAHWDGHALAVVPALQGTFTGVWSSAAGRVWLWGEQAAILYDGQTTTPVQTVLGASVEWIVQGIAESASGDLFLLTKRDTGTTLLWFDPSRTMLIEQLSTDLSLTAIRGRGDSIWAVGLGGASLRFAPPPATR